MNVTLTDDKQKYINNDNEPSNTTSSVHVHAVNSNNTNNSGDHHHHHHNHGHYHHHHHHQYEQPSGGSPTADELTTNIINAMTTPSTNTTPIPRPQHHHHHHHHQTSDINNNNNNNNVNSNNESSSQENVLSPPPSSSSTTVKKAPVLATPSATTSTTTTTTTTTNQEGDHHSVNTYSPSKVHILVVDDDQVQRKILESALKKFKYNVTVVTNGEEAWNILINGNTKYDLVLTDVMMPNISGFDLLQRINDHAEIKNVPVILMSGTAIDYKYANDTIKIGGQDFLTKPIAKELLKKKIDTVLNSILREKNEMDLRSQLSQEMETRAKLTKQMEAKEHEVEELTKKMNEMASFSRDAMESPLVSVTRSIEELMQQKGWAVHETEVKSKLLSILKELGSSNIYRPSFEKLIKSESVDPVTKSFLVTEFSSVTGTRRNSIPTFPQTSNKDTKEGIKEWEFDVFRYSEDDLMPMLVDMFENFQLLETFKIPIEKLQSFIMAVHSLYRKNNRYHNFMHAFDVTQTCYTFLTSFKAAEYLTHLDILSLLIASMCHDLNHPGFNNTFQVNAQTELSLQYNDNSVLEVKNRKKENEKNHHATLTFKILKNNDCNILEGLNEDQYKELRRSVIQLILATDMSFHFEYINKFQHHLNNQPFDRNKKEDRQMILNFLIKCGDISNVARPWHLNYEWSIRVSDEFFQQSNFEKVCGYPVTPFMDKTKTTRPRIAADFIDLVALPLFQNLCRFLTEAKVLMEMMSENRHKWQIELQKLEGRKEGDEQKAKDNDSPTTPTTNLNSSSSSSKSADIKLPSIDEEEMSKKTIIHVQNQITPIIQPNQIKPNSNHHNKFQQTKQTNKLK
ncbi:cAMP phosphodiesterase [Cavenderia fasciculata]|uniref:Phosphodiesterase n=1 Tax=Cavenderia fasciculata TaxID=261658 RepID=F4PK08_CACFS|nr:cAMP phosphodiesterase [Cavenderia fasciculata]EGG23932.1 cAMP phosphodiesterase [Cavenderia fasciculata]|eukprot:XP_004361783.1 cAMP phosphodiesterase [Cavenderia fasciculata]